MSPSVLSEIFWNTTTVMQFQKRREEGKKGMLFGGSGLTCASSVVFLFCFFWNPSRRSRDVSNRHDFTLRHHPHAATDFPFERMTALEAVSVSVTDSDPGSETEKLTLKGASQMMKRVKYSHFTHEMSSVIHETCLCLVL